MGQSLAAVRIVVEAWRAVFLVMSLEICFGVW